MPAPKKKEVLSYDIAQVVQLHNIEKNTLQETADQIGVSRKTVVNIKKTDLYHELAQQALEANNGSIEEWCKALVEQRDATKMTPQNVEVPDNNARLKAVDIALDVYGARAPQKIDHTHSLRQSSDEELEAQLEASLNDISGQCNTTGERDADDLAEDQDLEPEQGLVSVEPEIDSGDNREV